jgi:hypothetical protein
MVRTESWRRPFLLSEKDWRMKFQRCATVWEGTVSYEYACVCLQIFSVHVLEGMESLADGCTDQDEVY